MLIGGFQKFSLIDYPNRTCGIIFTQGCNFRCPFCHNPELVDPRLFSVPISFEEILSFLKRRTGLLDGVEFTGGEPTLQVDLREAILAVKNLGFLVKVDTNGSNPSLVKELIESKLVDYVAMDVKAPLEEYENAIGIKFNIENIVRSIEVIKNSSVEHEFRTTMIRGIIKGFDSVEKIGRLLNGAKLYFMQKPHFDKMLSPDFNGEAFTDSELAQFKQILGEYIEFVGIR